MTEEIKNESNAAAQPDEVCVMKIYMCRTGAIKIEGSIVQDELACLGILEKVKLTIHENHKPRIEKPIGGVMNFVRNGRR